MTWAPGRSEEVGGERRDRNEDDDDYGHDTMHYGFFLLAFSSLLLF